MDIDKIFEGERPTPELIEHKLREIMHGEDTDGRTMSEPTARMMKMYADAIGLDPINQYKLVVVVQHYHLTKMLNTLSEFQQAHPPVVMVDSLSREEVQEACDKHKTIRIKVDRDNPIDASDPEVIDRLRGSSDE